MKDLPLNKQAGPDRIPNAFFKVFRCQLGYLLSEVIQEATYLDKLPESLRKGDICMLYKGKGDRSDPRKYRPITLLQSAYKIYTRTLTRRLKKFIHQIISPQQ